LRELFNSAKFGKHHFSGTPSNNMTPRIQELIARLFRKVSMLDLHSVFGEILPRFIFVDIGAMALGTEPYAPLLDYGVGKVIGFEPVLEECEKLNEIHRNSGHLYLPYAIGDGSPGVFNICNYPMTSSLFEPNMQLVQKFQNLGELMQIVRKENVCTKRLDDITEVADADYLKMDAQGGELAILQGAHNVLKDTMIVHTEVEFVPLYKEQPLFADVDSELRQQGFLLHKFDGTTGRAFKPFAYENNLNRPISQMLWTNAVYVKDFTRFNELHPRKLLKLAIMLHELYQSFDLSALALKSFDEQTGFRIHERYCRCVTRNRFA
jgi:FkbM family methyltransferase